MSSAVWWMLFGTPLAAAVLSCAGRFRDWRSTTGRVGQLFAVALATIAVLYGCGSLVYVEVVGPMPPLDYRVEEFGLLLSLLAVIAGIVALLMYARPSPGMLCFGTLWLLFIEYWSAAAKNASASGERMTSNIRPDLAPVHALARGDRPLRRPEPPLKGRMGQKPDVVGQR